MIVKAEQKVETLDVCPFCGKKAGYVYRRNIGGYCIKCAVCEAKTLYYDTVEQAYRAWNKRLPSVHKKHWSGM